MGGHQPHRIIRTGLTAKQRANVLVHKAKDSHAAARRQAERAAQQARATVDVGSGPRRSWWELTGPEGFTAEATKQVAPSKETPHYRILREDQGPRSQPVEPDDPL